MFAPFMCHSHKLFASQHCSFFQVLSSASYHFWIEFQIHTISQDQASTSLLDSLEQKSKDKWLGAWVLYSHYPPKMSNKYPVSLLVIAESDLVHSQSVSLNVILLNMALARLECLLVVV